MTTWISLLRGVNVGGKNILPMKELRSLLSKLGYTKIQTYIQSGNCVFQANDVTASVISEQITNGIAENFGFEPSIMTLSVTQFSKAIKQNPFNVESIDPKSIHFYFLSEEPVNADIDTLSTLKSSSEEFILKKNVFYLLAPDGIGRSKLAARAESKLGVAATARNYRTVVKIAQLAAMV